MVDQSSGPHAIDALERWSTHGGSWRVVSLSPTEVEIELCSCHGEAMDRLRSSDADVLAYVAATAAERSG